MVWLLALANLFVFLSIGAFVAFSAYRSYGNVERRAEITANNLATVLDKEISGRIETIDLSLRTAALGIEREYARRPVNRQELNRILEQQRMLVPDIAALRATDSRGLIRYGTSLPSVPPVDVSDRAYFLKLRDDPNAGMVIDGPLIARIGETSVAAFARRLNNPDGSFGGVIFARISIKRFTQILTLMNLEPGAAITLRTADLKLVARYPELPAPSGRIEPPELRNALKINPEIGQFLTSNTADKVTRNAAYKRLSAYPMYIIVGLARNDYLAEWRRDVLNLFWLGTLALVLSALSSWMIYRLWVRQLAATNALAQRTVELERANKELNSFSYTIAHDMRAPVRAINGFSEMVLRASEGKLDPASVGHMKRVIAGSRHMGELIDDLLDLARLSRQEMTLRDFNFSGLAAAVVAVLAAGHPERTVSVTIQPDLHAEGDSGLIGALLDNLIGNAWKFTAKTNPARIDIGALQRDGQTVYFIRDNGAGFDMQYVHKLFAPFQRLHHSSEFEGTGIGLATVKRVIERHGGKVWIESTLNQGATVYFTIGAAT